MEFETTFARIEKMRAAWRDEYGPDAESTIAEIDRGLEAQLQKDPLLMYAGELFYKANLALRRQRIDTARRSQSNGVEANTEALTMLLWDSRLIDFFVADLRQSERLIKVGAFALETNLRIRTRSELRNACRQVSEMNTQQFERGFTSDAEVQAAEQRQAQREQPAAPGRTGVSNSDWRR